MSHGERPRELDPVLSMPQFLLNWPSNAFGLRVSAFVVCEVGSRAAPK